MLTAVIVWPNAGGRHCSDKQYSSMALSHLRDYLIVKFWFLLINRCLHFLLCYQYAETILFWLNPSATLVSGITQPHPLNRSSPNFNAVLFSSRATLMPQFAPMGSAVLRTMHDRHDRGQTEYRICFDIGRDLYGRPKNRPTINKVIIRNPGCTNFQTRCYFLAWLLTFGHSLYVWVDLYIGFVVCWCTRQPWTYRCVFRWHMKQPFKWAHVKVSFMVL